MLKKGVIDQATAGSILGKPVETSGSTGGGQKRHLEKPLENSGADPDDFEKCLDDLIQESKKQKLETLLQ